MKKAVIIGGGLGGLSAAITLQHAGFQVQLFEKNKHFGGKLMPVQLGDYSFDFGPNTITMPDVFKRVIEQTGEKAGEYFEFVKLPVHTRNIFSDGSELTFSSNSEMMEEALRKIDPEGAKNYGDYLREAGRIYYLAKKQFFPRIFHSWKDYLSPVLALSLAKVRPWETLDRFHRRYFRDERVIHALNRYATYVGSSPYRLPATFAMIGYLELVEGVYYVKGGNVRIAKGFEKLARKLGANLFLETEVQKILVSNRQVRGVQLANGEKIEADYVLVNGDLLESYPKLVEEEHRPRFTNQKAKSMDPSISAFVILAGIRGRLPGLQHHNVYFSSNYHREFQALFQEKRYADEPTIYICSSSRTDPGRSPGGDNLFILANAPALSPKGRMQTDPEQYKARIYEQLAHSGLDIRSVLETERVFTPEDITQLFGAYRGALYGVSSNRRMNAFLRPSAISKDIKNLLFVGGTTHPGGGSPMVTISGLNAARWIIQKERG